MEANMAHVNPIQVQKFLKGVDYPASKKELLDKAMSMGADENVRASLEQLPDEEFQTPADVSQAFGRLPDDDKGEAGRARQQAQPESAGQKAQPKGEPKEHAADRAKEHAADRTKEHAAERTKEHAADRAKDQPHGQQRYTGSNEFLIEAMQDTMAEIRICEIAIEKSANEDVKAFARMMIDEHGRMARELEMLAEQKKLNVPPKIRPEQEMTVKELSSVSGRDFEQRWIQYNIDVHERDVKVFRHYAGEEQDADIRKMAENAATMMSHHLKKAHELGKKLAKP
jgi:predicted outer membrane protein